MSTVIDAIQSRMSIRAYRPQPVPKDILEKVMEAALRAPSWADTQPWEFAIIGGEVMERVKAAMQKRAIEGVPGQPEIARPTFTEVHQDRSRQNSAKRFETMGITRDDDARRTEQRLKGARFFDAPNGIILYMDRELGPWSIFDTGMAVQNIMLTATHYSLGTCVAVAFVSQPDVLRSILSIPESKLIIVGLSIGHPDWQDPANRYRSQREPMDKLVTWHGF